MKTVFSFVVDQHPKFLMQGWTLLLSLAEVGILGASDILVIAHHPEEMTGDERLAIYERLGARLAPFTPYGSGPAAYCNKLRQLENADVRAAGTVVFLDADVLVMGDLRTLFEPGKVRAKIVDVGAPKEEIWRSLFGAAGLTDEPALAAPSFNPKARTPMVNCNGGVYIIPGSALAPLSEAWPRWAGFCLGRPDLMGRKLLHADQLGFAMAMLELNIPFSPLPLEGNFPTHFRAAAYGGLAPRPVLAAHYHGHVDTHGLPRPVGIDWFDSQLRKVNDKISIRRRDEFDNRIFWDYRYATRPGLGSGLGSRGDVLVRKQEFLAPYLMQYCDRKVLDIGCGDIETMRQVPLKHYIGVDPAEQALEIARTKRPDWTFSSDPLGRFGDASAHLVLCLDVSIHQSKPEDYHDLIDQTIRIASEAVIVAGYERPPSGKGIVYFHEPLSKTLRDHPDVTHVEEIGAYRDTVMFLAITKDKSGAKRRRIQKKAQGYAAAD